MGVTTPVMRARSGPFSSLTSVVLLMVSAWASKKVVRFYAPYRDTNATLRTPRINGKL